MEYTIMQQNATPFQVPALPYFRGNSLGIFRHFVNQEYFMQVVPSPSPAFDRRQCLLKPPNYFRNADELQHENTLSLVFFRFINLDLMRTLLRFTDIRRHPTRGDTP